MAYKFPWTNYHELNLDWILDTVKKLFAQTEQNNAVVEQYDGRLTEVELTADNAQTAAEQAQSDSAAALSLAQNAQTTATQAQQAAGQAQQAAGQAQTAAGQAQEAAATAQQTATQAQQTAQNFDGRITQAENNAASALQAAQAFDEQVQGAITAANNANTAATTALTTATETARELAAQRSTLEGIVSDGVDSLQEAAQNATEEIEAAGQTVRDSIPADYTTLSDIVTNKKADVICNTAAGDIASFNDGADDMKIKNLIVNIEPIQAGSGDPSPDNVRPISGRTGAVVTRTGKNLSTFADVSGERPTANLSYQNFIGTGVTLIAGKTYTISADINTSVTPFIFSALYANSPTIAPVGEIARTANNLTNGKVSLTFTAPESANGKYLIFRIQYNSLTAFSYTVKNFQCELGSIATEYESYKSSQISVTFPDEAGTVYGGTLTINPDRTGQLVVDRAGKTFTTFESFSASPKLIRLTSNSKPVGNSEVGNVISSYLLTTYVNNIWGNSGVSGVAGSPGGYIYARIAGLSTAEEYSEYLTSNPLQVCYELATPITYTLTESQISGILSTLYGTNNIWASTGDTQVTYPADTKLYIDNKFAELQALILEH